MVTVHVLARPYAQAFGRLQIPKEFLDDVENYVEEHFDDIDFDKPELDFVGTDFDICTVD